MPSFDAKIEEIYDKAAPEEDDGYFEQMRALLMQT
jgi:hypothetical protein